MEIIKWLIVFPIACVIAYFIYAIFFGLFGSLVCWDIQVVINLVQFWKNTENLFARGLLWVLSIGSAGLTLIED